MPATTALASWVIRRRARSYSGLPRAPSSPLTTPAIPSMSTVTKTRNGRLLPWCGRLAGPLQLRVERVAQPVAQQVERQHGGEDGEAGEDRDVRRQLQELPAVAEHRAPLGRGRPDAQAQEAQAGRR